MFDARIVAQIVDNLISVVLFYGIFFLTAFVVPVGSGPSGSTSSAASGLALVGLLLAFVAPVSYYLLLEGLWDGYTVGKRAMGIKVVKEDGSPCTLGASIVRNLLDIVDQLPFLYIVGILLISTSDTRQRLGDRVASTVVVKE